jgi:TPR repeat protein
MIDEVRRLTRQHRKVLDEVRLHWLEGRLAVSDGRTEEAAALLMQVRGEFASRLMAFDGALVSLELAEVYAAQGRADAVKSLARQMAWIFEGVGVHSEAKKAIALFRRAAEQEAVTVELAHRLVEYLHLARHDPQLRFEAA